jgi:hypothetical protein
MKIVTKQNGKFGLQRISSGCVYGDFDSYAEALVAMCEAAAADSYRAE